MNSKNHHSVNRAEFETGKNPLLNWALFLFDNPFQFC